MTCPAIEKLILNRKTACPCISVKVINKERIEKLTKLNWHKAFRGVCTSNSAPFGNQFYEFFCFTGAAVFPRLFTHRNEVST